MSIITIIAEPKGKGRPRFTRTGHAYTPQGTREYEEYVKYEYKKQGGEYYEKDVPLKIEIIAYYKIPKQTRKGDIKRMVDCELLPCKKPDTDNIIKIICDALNGLAYYDDSQICYTTIKKMYGLTPSVAFKISKIEDIND